MKKKTLKKNVRGCEFEFLDLPTDGITTMSDENVARSTTAACRIRPIVRIDAREALLACNVTWSLRQL